MEFRRFGGDVEQGNNPIAIRALLLNPAFPYLPFIEGGNGDSVYPARSRRC
jgi:hypothetical protein